MDQRQVPIHHVPVTMHQAQTSPWPPVSQQALQYGCMLPQQPSDIRHISLDNRAGISADKNSMLLNEHRLLPGLSLGNNPPMLYQHTELSSTAHPYAAYGLASIPTIPIQHHGIINKTEQPIVNISDPKISSGDSMMKNASQSGSGTNVSSETVEKQITPPQLPCTSTQTFKGGAACNDVDLEDDLLDELELNDDDAWPYTCLKCNEIFTLKKQLHKHKMIPCKKIVHRKNSCEFCHRTFSRSDHVSRHIRTLHAAKFKLWQAMQKQRRALRRRVTKRSKEKEELRSRTCEFCLKLFTTIEERDEHLKQHANSPTPYLCTVCGATFQNASRLHLHRRTRCGELAIQCPMCDFETMSNESLKKHEMVHGVDKPYKCGECEEGFLNKSAFQSHQYVHGEEKPHVCEQCQLTFTTSEHLKHHSLSHNGEKPYKCSICPLSFDDEMTLKVHISTHLGDKPYICQVCSMSFPTSSNLKAHLRKHTGDRSHLCQYCQRPFSRSDTLKKHERTHTGEKPFVCRFCTKAYSRRDKLNKHEKAHRELLQHQQAAGDNVAAVGGPADLLQNPSMIKPEGSRPKDFDEEYCKAMKDRAMRMDPGSSSALPNPIMRLDIKEEIEDRVNEGVHDESDLYNGTTDEDKSGYSEDKDSSPIKDSNESFPCTICFKLFPTKLACRNHQNAAHKSTERLLYCVECKEHFSDEAAQQQHEQLHTFKCSICTRSFISAESLHKHMVRHEKQKCHECSVCNKAFFRKDHLRQHEKRHKGQMAAHVECQYCCMAFLTKEDAARHQATSHEATDKPYLCIVCREQFSSKSLLIGHKTVHKGQKPFSCDVCNRTFHLHSALLMHSQSHSDIKPYKCEECNDYFHSPGHVKRHMMIHTGEKPFGCTVCNMSFNQACTLKVHERTHSGSKPFVCETCGSSFRAMSNLRSHQRKHLGIKTYECSFCQRKFARSDTLKNHERIHRGERPFVCSVCGLAFTRKDKMKAHERRHQNGGTTPTVRKRSTATAATIATATTSTPTAATTTAASPPASSSNIVQCTPFPPKPSMPPPTPPTYHPYPTASPFPPSKPVMPPPPAPSPYHHAYPASPQVYHPPPSPHPYQPTPSPSHYPQVSTAMSGYADAASYQPLFSPQSAQSYHISHSSIMQL